MALQLLYLLQDLLRLLPGWHSLLQEALRLSTPVHHLQVLLWQQGRRWGGWRWRHPVFVRGFGLQGLKGSRKAQGDLLTWTGQLLAAPQTRGVGFTDLHWIRSFNLRGVRSTWICFRWLLYRRVSLFVGTRGWSLEFWWMESVGALCLRTVSGS